MNLFLTGPFDIEMMSDFVRSNQAKKDFADLAEIQRKEIKASGPISGESLELEVAMPKFAFGLRGEDQLSSDSKTLFKYKLANQLFLDLLFGRTSQRYEELYNSGLIDDSFGFSFDLDKRFHFAVLTADTENPQILGQTLQEAIKSYKIDRDFSEEHLDLLKREMLGDYFSSLNSLEYIANQFSSEIYGDLTFFDFPEILKGLSLSEIEKFADQFISEMKKVEFTILPK